MVVPDRDYFACPEDEISEITSDLTIVGGKVVYGSDAFASHDDAVPPRHCLTGHRFARLGAMVLGVTVVSGNLRPAKNSRVPVAAPMPVTFTAMTMLPPGREWFRYPI